MTSYAHEYRLSIEQPDLFWESKAAMVDWDSPWRQVLDRDATPAARWFAGGRLNTCFNCVDRHVLAGHGERTAVCYESPVTGISSTMSYERLRDRVARVAGGLSALGVRKGDRVLIYMPMIPETLIAMLACARLGAVHSLVFGGFAAEELAVRIDGARPKLVLWGSCGIEPSRVVAYQPLLEHALKLADWQVEATVVKQREQSLAVLRDGRDVDWVELESEAGPVDCVPVDATDPLYIMYTSGTTGRPKGVVRDNGGHAVALTWSMKAVYDIDAGDVFWAVSDMGWQLGHSYIVYGPLLAGATTVVYEGKPVGTPDAGQYWRVIERLGVKAVLTAPTAIRAIRREDPHGSLAVDRDFSSLEAVYLAGERLDTQTYQWTGDLLGVPVVDHYWQTESGWPMCCISRGIEKLPTRPGSVNLPVPGYEVKVLDDEGNALGPGLEGILAVRLPLPPGAFPTLWGDDEGFTRTYLSPLPGYYYTGDGGTTDEDGYLYVSGRLDDIINVAGHRLSTGRMEEVLSRHPDVAECAVVGAADTLKGQVPLGLVVLKSGVDRDHGEIVTELIAMVRDQIGPVAAFRRVVVVARLPKTRSGKVLRGMVRKLADGEGFSPPATIEDPSVLEDLRAMIGPSREQVGHAR
jgi:propionyl-CoA synthetase